MFERRNLVAAVMALFCAVTLYGVTPAFSAATIDRSVCSAADKAGGNPSLCDAGELVDSANQEINKLYQGNILVVNGLTGTNDIAGTTTPAATVLVDGEMRQFTAVNSNTGAMRYNDNSLGLIAIKTSAGGSLGNNDVVAGTTYMMRYYAANNEWRILSLLGTGTATASAPYVTIGNTGSLSAERALTEGTNGIDLVDGGANGAVTLNLDTTEVGSTTWGSGASGYNWSFNLSGTDDPIFSANVGGFAIQNNDGTASYLLLNDQASLYFREEAANGFNQFRFVAPSAITSDATCTFENDANFIPDSCVGNGTDDGLISTQVDTSAEIAAIVTDETGSGALVFANSPTLVTPALGTPSSATLTNATGLPVSTGISGMASGAATFLATPSSANLAALTTDETGTGANVMANTPTLVTPVLGAATATSINKVAITAPATGATITIPDGVTVTGPAASDTLVGRASTDTLTNKSISLGSNTVTATSAQLATAVSDETGSGAAVFATSPTLVTPNLGTPSAGVLTNATGLPVSTGIAGLGTGVATALATPSSANWATAFSDESGTGSIAFTNSPTFVTPALGTPSAAVLTNATGLPVSTGIAGLGVGVATALATPSSANLAAAITDETGSGSLVFATSPTLTTPTLGVASATTINKVTITAPATGSTLTIPDGVTMTGPAASGTVMTLGNAETVTGAKTFGAAGNVGKLKIAGTTSGTITLDAAATAGTNTLTLPAATDTLVGKATTDTLTNKTFDTAGTGNSFSINGVAATANTGTGAVARAVSPAFTTPDLGTPSAATLTNATGLPIGGISGLGTGVGTFLATPSSSNLAAALTDETGSGAAVFGTSPTFTTDVTLGSDTISDFTGFGLALNTGALGIDVTGASDEFCLTYESTGPAIQWQACGGGGGGGGTPGGSNGQIQYNDAGVFEGFTASGDITIDPTTGDTQIQANVITASEIATDAVDAAEIKAGAVGTSEIADGTVAYADIQNLATDRLLGRDTAGSGSVEELTVGGGLEFTGSAGIQRSALTGDVTASAGSNSTTIAADAVALGTDTTGNYAAGDAEAGAALTGDSATAFFSAGTLELARGGTGASLSDPNANRITYWDDGSNTMDWLALGTAYSISSDTLRNPRESFCVAVSDETTALTTGTAKVTFRMPYAFTLTAVRASVNTVSSSGLPTFDLNEGGASVFSTTLTIDANEKTSTTAATAAVISDTSLADDAEMTIDQDGAGTGTKGAKVCLIGYQT